MSKENQNTEKQVSSKTQERSDVARRREARIKRAGEDGSFVLQIHSGDEMYSLVSLIPQLDRGLSLLQQRSRRFSTPERQAINERVIKLVDSILALTEDVCTMTGVRFWVPRPLLPDDKKIKNVEKDD